MRITASAPGKLLLLGDHAVVYDRPCLVTAVDIRYTVSIETRQDTLLTISTPQMRDKGQLYSRSLEDLAAPFPQETAFVEAAVARIFAQFGGGAGLEIVTDGPQISYGLGSSSAVTVATAAALTRLLGHDLKPRQLFDLCYRAVLDVQGTGSGFDVAAAVYGGTLYFVSGGQVIEPLSQFDLPLIIGYSGEKVGTVNLVRSVADLFERYPNLVDPLFNLSQRVVEKGRIALLNSDWAQFGDYMNIHQGILESLGVNTERLSRLIYAARDAGASGAKLSGAGGGDCMFALVDQHAEESVKAALIRAGGQIVDYALHAQGVYFIQD